MREKKRVIQIAIESSEGAHALNEKEARLVVNEAVFSFLGESGASKAPVKFVRWSESKQEGFLKCNTPFLQETIAALALKKEFRGQKIAVRTLKLAGSVPRQ